MWRSPRSLFQLPCPPVKTSTAWVFLRPVRRSRVCRQTFVRKRSFLPEHSAVSPAAAFQLHALHARMCPATLLPVVTTSAPAQPLSVTPIARSGLSQTQQPRAAVTCTDNFRTTRVLLFRACSSLTTSRSIATDRTPQVFVINSSILSIALHGPTPDQSSSPALLLTQTTTASRLLRGQPFRSRIKS